jgi:hypothetical protein
MIKRSIIPNIVNVTSNTNNIHYYSYGENIKEKIFQDGDAKVEVKFLLEDNKYFEDKLKNSKTVSTFSDCIFFLGVGKKIDLIYKKIIYPYGKLYIHLIQDKNSINMKN